MFDRLDRTERLTLALTGLFAVTLALTRWTNEPVAWVLWGAAMVLLSGGALVWANRVDADDG